MGIYKAEKPIIPKELVRPALMIMSPADSFEPYAIAQDTSNPSSHPTIDRGKGPSIAMFEVLKPSSHGAVDVFDDHCQAMPVAAAGLGADSILELLEALPSRPASAVLKVVPKKVKSLSRNAEIDNSRLLRVQGETSFRA